MTPPRHVLALTSALVLSLSLAACSSDSEPEAKPKPSATATSTPKPIDVSIGVWGTDAEITAWKDVLATRDEKNPTVKTELVTWKDSDAARAQVESGDLPDVFMVTRNDLGTVLENQAAVPASELLDERGVDFGDLFSRDALMAMSAQGELQCMPWSIQTDVLYVNTDLVDFDAMREQGLSVAGTKDAWGLDNFAAAAAFASRPDTRTAGVQVDATVEALAPFLLSGGANIFDDDANPTSLNFSDDTSREALRQTLAILRDASLTPTDKQLAKYSPLELFKRGKLGMIAGDRTLVPELREVEGLNFDVKPYPRLSQIRTSGDVVGLCISAESEFPALAASLIADVVADGPTGQIAEAGAMTPANLAVAGSQRFLQRDLMPSRSRVFTSTLRGTWFRPTSVDWDGLEAAVDPILERLLNEPGEIDLNAYTTEIDEASRAFFTAEAEKKAAEEAAEQAEKDGATTSPSVSPSATPSASTAPQN
ncbi:hypothetical protein [Nocardioides yefusunii]|uniref:Extracellular solute-binding protein n=1 Tax=Nocardioides yefusunii TaxID=2500546 RepID=A0ABW1QW29_9ACTN|nr:hypothetical protein [Nocardioides yefusunii]